MDKLLKKLHYKMAERPHCAVLNAPAEFRITFQQNGFAVAVPQAGELDFVLLFVKNRAEFEQQIKPAVASATRDNLFWIAYPKGSGNIESDLNRNLMWELLQPFGLRPVSQIAIDADWSALRFRPVEAVKSRRGNTGVK